MNIKKIVALVIALAMIISVVPGLGITASAADEYTLDQLVSFAANDGYVFDGSLGKGAVAGDNSVDNNIKIGTITSPEHWTGWSSSWDSATANIESGGTNVNMKADGANYIQFYGAKVTSLDQAATVTTSEAVKIGTTDRDFIIIEWGLSSGSNEFDVAFYDNDNHYFDAFRYLPNKNIGPFYADNKGGNYTYNSGQLFTDLSYTTNGGDWASLGDNTSSARLVYVNNADGGYTATYYKSTDGSTYTAVTTKTFASGKVEKLAAIKAYHSNFDNGWWNNVQLRDLKIYAGNYPSEEIVSTTVTVKYVDETGKDVKDSKTVEGVFAGYPYVYDASGDGVIASADFAVYRKVSTADSTLSIESLDKNASQNVITVVYKPISFAAANTPAVGSDIAVGEKLYKVVNDTNKVPNPSFETVDGEYSITGWYGGTNGKSNTSPYPEAHQTSSTDATAGKYSFGSRYGDAWNGLCTLLTSFKVESGKTYYFAYDVKYAHNSTPRDGATVSVGIGEGPYGVSKDNDQKTNTNISGVGSNWTTNTRIITVDSGVAEDPYIQFNAYYIGNSTNNGDMPKFLFDNFILVEVEEAGGIQPNAVADINKITVIDGNEPILPTTVTLTNTNYANWSTTGTVTEWTGDSTVGTHTYTGSVNEYPGLTAKVEVEVLSKTFDMPDQESTNGQPGNTAYLPISISDEFSMEFDLYVNAIKDSSVQIGADGKIFGAGQIGLGTNGNFIPTSGNGTGGGNTGAAITTVEAGKTYRIFLTVNPGDNSYTISLTKEDGSVYTGGTRYFRTNADYINTITMLTNGGGANGDLKITNVKFHAPSVADQLSEYTIKYAGLGSDVDLSGAQTSVHTTDSTDLGYRTNKVFPNLAIPHFDGYVFKSKTVSGTTITLTYEPTQNVEFFANHTDMDAPFISLNMLGAHDAFTSGMPNSNTGGWRDAAAISRYDGNKLSSDYLAAAGARNAVNSTKTQNEDVLTMLNHGVRYFDIRLSRSDSATLTSEASYSTNGVFYTTHNLLSDEFGPIASTIAQWAKEHPGEIIVLDFQEIWDATPAGGTGDDKHGSTAQTWRDLDSLLRDTGVKDFVTIGNSDISGHTYGSLTNNGTKSNIVLFGRYAATNSNVGNFIARGPSTANGSGGYVYSNYERAQVGTSYSDSFIEWQLNNCKKTGTHYVASMFRIMQAQSENSNLLNQTGSDNKALYDALIAENHSEWLTYLPVIMVNGIGNNTADLVTLLQGLNKAQKTTVDLTGEGAGTSTTNTMVGTLYVGNGELLQGGEYGYYVTTETPTGASDNVIKVPYNGNLTLSVAALPSIYSMRFNETVNRYNALSNTNGGGYNIAYLPGSDDGATEGAFYAYNWGAADAASDHYRVGVAVLTAEKGHNAYTLDATRVRNTSYRGTNNLSFYAISYEEYQQLDISDFSAVVAKFTDANKVASMAISGDNLDDKNENTHVSIPLDAEKLQNAIGASGKVVILGDSHGGLYALKNDMVINGIDLAKLIPSLGWNGSDFTVNFIVDGDKTANFTVTPEGGKAESFEASKGVAITTPNTNRIYTAVVTEGAAKGEAVMASVYSLVVDEILSNKYGDDDELSSKRIAKANEVIANGGIVDATTLVEKTADIMDVKGNTITMKNAATKLGIGFIVNGGTLFVGGSDKTVTGDAEKVYAALTIDGDSVTLSGEIIDGEVIPSEALTLSLESVNIEFIETFINESAADGADADFDFTTEL